MSVPSLTNAVLRIMLGTELVVGAMLDRGQGLRLGIELGAA
jgi:hypothetical protein